MRTKRSAAANNNDFHIFFHDRGGKLVGSSESFVVLYSPDEATVSLQL
jgi:hypothetical protein